MDKAALESIADKNENFKNSPCSGLAMRMLFVNPNLGGDFSAMDIATTSLATYINERSEHSASIVDLTFHRRHWKRHLHSAVVRHKPAVVGISTTTLYMNYIREIVTELRKATDARIILGGYHASIHPEKTLTIPGVSSVCIGDGEHSLTRYLDSLEARKHRKIAGIWEKSNGRIIRTGKGRFLRDLDSLPYPDWSLWEDLDKYFYYLGMIYVIGSRGCPYACSFCDARGMSEAAAGTYFRVRSPEDYALEIKHHYEKYRHRGLRFAQLFDQVPTQSREWLERFCKAYISEGMHRKLKYSMFSRIDHLDSEKIRMLAQSGCAILRAGIETGDENIRRNVYNKNFSNRQVLDIIGEARNAGISFTSFFMLGGPADTFQTVQKTIRFAQELGSARTAFFMYKPISGQSKSLAKAYGAKILQHRMDSSDNITYGAVVSAPRLPAWRADLLQKLAYIKTFPKRLVATVVREKHVYFMRLAAYLIHGRRDGLDFRYLLVYYHIYGYENVDK